MLCIYSSKKQLKQRANPNTDHTFKFFTTKTINAQLESDCDKSDSYHRQPGYVTQIDEIISAEAQFQIANGNLDENDGRIELVKFRR